MTIGLSNWTSTALSLLASSTEYSTAYVYADVGGSSPGIAAGPLSPMVNSVARMFSRSPSVLLGAVGQRGGGLGARLDQQRRAARAVAVGDRRALRDLELVVGQVHAGDAVLVGDHDDLLDALELLRRDLELALGGHVALALERERDRAAAVDGDVEAAVGARGRAAELGVVDDRDPHTLDRRAVAARDLAAQDGRARGLDRARLDLLLDRGRARVEELGGVGDERDLAGVGRGRLGLGRGGGRVGRAGRGRLELDPPRLARDDRVRRAALGADLERVLAGEDVVDHDRRGARGERRVVEPALEAVGGLVGGEREARALQRGDVAGGLDQARGNGSGVAVAVAVAVSVAVGIAVGWNAGGVTTGAGAPPPGAGVPARGWSRHRRAARRSSSTTRPGSCWSPCSP